MQHPRLLQSILPGAVAVAVCLGSALALADDTQVFYGKVNAGRVATRNAGGDFAHGFGRGNTLGAAAGYRFSPEFRVDVEIAARLGLNFRDLETEPEGIVVKSTARIRSTAFMVNGTYAPFALGPVRPYVTAGIGIARNRVESLGISADGIPLATQNGASVTNLAFQAGTGVSVALGSAMSLDVGYRYADLGRLRTSQTLVFAPSMGGETLSDPDLRMNGRLRTHEIVASLVYSF